MPKYYLLVEAVNIADFVYDTYDISTIRGGSYLLLDAIESLRENFKDRLTPISTAASQGLFSFETSDSDIDKACPSIRKDVLEYLHKKTDGHTTFLVAIQEDIPEHFSQVLEILESQIRRQQWRMPTISVPKPAVTAKECYLDGWRPGVEDYPFESGKVISAATAFRRRNGIAIKHRLFYELLKDERYLGQISTRDLGELATDTSKGILNGKIAFIHLDGNSFGLIRRDYCGTEQDRKDFDQTIQDGFRNSFLKTLLDQAIADPDFRVKGSDGKTTLRLEVLLWGGDEMTIVVPAWLGWRVMRLFYEHARSLQFKDVPLSHRATIIFCHHNAPILLIRQLADDLLVRTKDDIKAKLDIFPVYQKLNSVEREKLKARLSDHALGDALHCLVLESFDLLQGDIEHFLRNYYKGGNYTDLLIYAGELDIVLKAIHTIQSKVARGKALKIIEALRDKNIENAKTITQEIFDLFPVGERGSVQDAVTTLTQAGQRLDRWYLATDLWDYVLEGAIS